MTVRKKELPNRRKKVPWMRRKRDAPREREREVGTCAAIVEPTQIEKKLQGDLHR
jgi:hypothetical protein